MRASLGGVQLGVFHRLWFLGLALTYEDDVRMFRVAEATGAMRWTAKGDNPAGAPWWRPGSRSDQPGYLAGQPRVCGPVRYADAVYSVPRADAAVEHNGVSMPLVDAGDGDHRHPYQRVIAARERVMPELREERVCAARDCDNVFEARGSGGGARRRQIVKEACFAALSVGHP